MYNIAIDSKDSKVYQSQGANTFEQLQKYNVSTSMKYQYP